MKSMTGLAFVCLAAPLLIGAVVLPQWQQQLSAQLKTEQNCEVKSFSKTRLGIRNGQESIDTRVTCADNRVFQASRQGPKTQPFVLKECKDGAC